MSATSRASAAQRPHAAANPAAATPAIATTKAKDKVPAADNTPSPPAAGSPSADSGAATTVGQVLVALGIDADKKPHAARFRLADKELVLRAAGLMGLKVLQMNQKAFDALGVRLPDGKIYATGRGLVPFVRKDFFDRLAVLVGTEAELAVSKPAAQPGPAAAPTKPATPTNAKASTPAAGATATSAPANGQRSGPSPALVGAGFVLAESWLALTVGNTVLARDDENEAWFEAIIISVADDDNNVLRLRWRDYPLERQFALHRSRVAVLGPGCK